MLQCKTQNIKNQFEYYAKSQNHTLRDVYGSYSYQKEKAMNYCQELMKKYNGYGLKIISFNTFQFSVGFIAYLPDEKTREVKQAFCYITRNYDRFIFTEDLPYNLFWTYSYLLA